MKFRAWDSLTKQWLAVGFHLFGEVTCFDIVGQKLTPNPAKPDQGSLLRMNDVIVTQWTGLCDRQGKEIYEGDILSMKSDKHAPGGGYIAGTYRHHPENAKVVEYRNAAFYLDRHLLHSEVVFQERYGGLEILGNIYEHPELLTQEAR